MFPRPKKGRSKMRENLHDLIAFSFGFTLGAALMRLACLILMGV
jgi:hypothetical protein